jgi:hypothetical protein
MLPTSKAYKEAMMPRNESGNICDCRRNGKRFAIEQDVVIHHKGIKYPSKMKNISITGVIASIPELLPDTIQAGDTCGLSFNANPAVESEVYASKVSRIDSAEVALCFSGFIL